MGDKHSSLFVACIKCGSPTPSVLDSRGEYADIFVERLQSVASKTPGWEERNISYLSFDARKGFLPSVDGFDAVVVTGSGKNEPYYAVETIKS